MKRGVYHLFACLATIGATIGCQEGSVLPPTAPTPLPIDKVGQLTISCPADAVAQSLNGVSASVSYPPPQVGGGLDPVATDCVPPSGSSLPIGTSIANCTTTDVLGQRATCSFTATVLAPPQLGETRFLAFGDSITAGETSPSLFGSRLLELLKSYPFKLENRLREAYPVQTITVVNAGLPGERVALGGVARFSTQLTNIQPQVALIMEGTNDLNYVAVPESEIAAAIESMVIEAQGRGVDPILATIAPARPYGESTFPVRIPILNDLIRGIAVGRGIPLVDVFAVINAGACASSAPTLPCIGADNLHPTAEGYELIADAFFDVIVENYDVPVTSLSDADSNYPTASFGATGGKGDRP